MNRADYPAIAPEVFAMVEEINLLLKASVTDNDHKLQALVIMLAAQACATGAVHQHVLGAYLEVVEVMLSAHGAMRAPSGPLN